MYRGKKVYFPVKNAYQVFEKLDFGSSYEPRMKLLSIQEPTLKFMEKYPGLLYWYCINTRAHQPNSLILYSHVEVYNYCVMKTISMSPLKKISKLQSKKQTKQSDKHTYLLEKTKQINKQTKQINKRK